MTLMSCLSADAFTRDGSECLAPTGARVVDRLRERASRAMNDENETSAPACPESFRVHFTLLHRFPRIAVRC
jgi:hypothetical protein